MIVKFVQIEKALSKLRQQFTKCVLFGCEHPIFCYEYYATSEEKLQELLTFLRKKFAILRKNRCGGHNICREKTALEVGAKTFFTHF